MNRINKYRQKLSWLFLLGYSALIFYSGFHYHKIDIQNKEAVATQHSPNQSANFDSINSVFACQFSIFYTVSYFNDSANLSSLILKNDAESNIILNNDQHHYLISLNQDNLRAPPKNS